MEDTEIVSLTPQHLAQVDDWTSRNAKTLLKLPGVSSDNDNMLGWALIHGNEVLAVAFVRLNEKHVGYLEARVKPSTERQGLATAIVEYTLKQPEVKALVHLHAAVELNNTAAQKILENHGFTRVGYSDDGRMEYANHEHNTDEGN
jgi:ribosomal protein S18 acetylase RimI-like enzyme